MYAQRQVSALRCYNLTKLFTKENGDMYGDM